MPSRLDDINPASIERIEILKGAAAATLYGTEASNGVIQIFTKAGQAGAPRWNLQLEQGLSRYPMGRYKPHSGFARTPAQAAAISQHFGLGSLQPFEVFEVNMWDDIVETGSMGNYSLSVNGGNERVTYFVAGRYLGEDGPFRADGFGAPMPGMQYAQDLNSKRQANANLTFAPWESVRIRANSMYIDGHQQVPDNNNNIYGTVSTLTNSKPERANRRTTRPDRTSPRSASRCTA
jgi:TonB-dependent starch-binding outer membrane protein SusC